MRKILFILFATICIASNAQLLPSTKGFIRAGSGSGGGSNVTISGTFTANGTGATVVNCGTIPANAFIVLCIAGGTDANNTTINDTRSLTWTKRADAQASNSGDCEIWTAPFGGSSNTLSVTANIASSLNSICIYVITNQETTFGTTGVTQTAASQPSLSVTTTRANSIVIWVTSSFNAANGGTWTSSPTAPTSTTYRASVITDYYFRNSSDHTGWFYHIAAPTTGSYTGGFTAPSSAQGGTCGIEIRGN